MLPVSDLRRSAVKLFPTVLVQIESGEDVGRGRCVDPDI